MKTVILFFVYIISFFSVAGHAQVKKESATKLLWETMSGVKGAWKANVAEVIDQGRKILFISVLVEDSGVASIKLKSDNESLPIQIQKKGATRYFLLSESQGHLEVTNTAGKMTLYHFNFETNSSVLKISSSCAKFNLKLEILLSDAKDAPAILSCVGVNDDLKDVIFSTTGDAKWFGGEVFETIGKGERWKMFAGKDIIALPDSQWLLKWGLGEKRNSARIRVVKQKKVLIESKPALTFLAGAQYLSGQIEKSSVQSAIQGLVIPLEIQYQPNKSWWYVGMTYDFFAYALRKDDTGSNSSSLLVLHGGLKYQLKSLSLRADVGYLNRALDAPGVKVSSNFESARYLVEVGYDLSNLGQVSFSYGLSRTSNQGQFAETDFNAYYQNKFFWNKNTRLSISTSTIKASVLSIDLKSQWATIGVGFQF